MFSRSVEQLTEEIHGILTGERLASFLPLVSQLGEEYDTSAVAAAALQMAFDRYPPVGEKLDALNSPKPVKKTPPPSPIKRRSSGVASS